MTAGGKHDISPEQVTMSWKKKAVLKQITERKELCVKKLYWRVRTLNKNQMKMRKLYAIIVRNCLRLGKSLLNIVKPSVSHVS